ncbi:hypothetical protein [Jeotgalibacillus proteolyticus]|uniref:hypothetical protein n=1 Tax=Jeotgalibacillus proteolyticus TaxID=2082395 RepID=UPI00142FB6D5|nr:hypothetical protein [Jeotgalibacillus proteolyticus]
MKKGDIILYNGEEHTILSIDSKNFCTLKRKLTPMTIELVHLKDIRQCPIMSNAH